VNKPSLLLVVFMLLLLLLLMLMLLLPLTLIVFMPALLERRARATARESRRRAWRYRRVW
jgi:hypothetical protein